MHRLILVLCLYLSSCLPAQATPTMWMCTGYTNPDATPYLLRFDTETRYLEVYFQGGKLSYSLTLQAPTAVDDVVGYTASVAEGRDTYGVVFFVHKPSNTMFYGLVKNGGEPALWQCR